MIFNSWDYYLIFLIPSAILCRVASPRAAPLGDIHERRSFLHVFLLHAVWRDCRSRLPWRFFFGNRWSVVSTSHRRGFAGLASRRRFLFLVLFKYRNFLTGLFWHDTAHNPLYWKNAFLPLGISFFTFEFLHYAVDRYKNKTEEGSATEYLAFILFFPTMVAGPIKRYQDFLPKLRSISREWVIDWQRGAHSNSHRPGRRNSRSPTSSPRTRTT